MAGLAGGVLVCCSSAVCAASAVESNQIPSPERQLVTAIQAAYPGDGIAGSESSLRLSPVLVLPAVAGAAPRWSEGADEATSLRVASELALPGAELPSPSAILPPVVTGEKDLRLSQAMGLTKSPRMTPRWMTQPDGPTQLRPSRTLSMPGAAGAGRTPPPGTTVVPLAGDEGELPIDGGFVGTQPAVAQAAAGQGEAVTPSTGIAGLGWEIPPIRWGGSLGYSIQKSTSNSGTSSTSSTSQGLLANLNVSSYIYAPWFATVSGRIGITNSNSSSSASSAGEGDTNQSANIIGGGELSMFSSSRFPFRAYFDRSDSRTSGTIVRQDYVNTRMGLSQNYRTEDGQSSGNFMLDRSSVETSDRRNDSVTSLSGSYSTHTGLWQHNMNARYSQSERQGTGEGVRLIGFNTSHNANLSEYANLGATVNYSDSDMQTANSDGGLLSNRGRFLQVYGYGSWMPEFEDLDDLPLTLNGSLRYGSQETQFGDSKSAAQTVGANLSALYRFSNNLSASLNTALNHIAVSNGESRLLTLVGSNINYVGNPLTIGNFSYNWNVGGNANWQSGSGETPASSLLGATASHSVNRAYQIATGQTLSLGFSQSLIATSSQSIGTSQSLSNNLSLNYGVYSGDRFSGSLSGMLSDVYSTGVNAQHYKNMNLGLVVQGQLSQQSSLNVNLMFNWSDQTNQTQDSFGLAQTMNSERMTLNGSVNYSHLRFAGVRGLRYNVLFAADTRLRDDRLFGDVNAEQDRSRLSLTNRLDYAIGLLNFRLSLVNNDAGGKKNALLFFQVTRQFGSY
ncbi:hypothetical protein [Dechloromonas sp. A34]|uniref:hypothetical protein n=1 Tax=Dechloromonas sp. A34 TaxID=447588 RepID=UPI002248C2C5|nr:hypothetical protein [Dechloromonas sp. A34]